MFHLVPTREEHCRNAAREQPRVRHKIETLFIQFIHATTLNVQKCMWTLCELLQLNDPNIITTCMLQRIDAREMEKECSSVEVWVFHCLMQQWNSIYNIWSGSRKISVLSCGKVHQGPPPPSFLWMCFLTEKENLDNNFPKDYILWFSQINYCR